MKSIYITLLCLLSFNISYPKGTDKLKPEGYYIHVIDFTNGTKEKYLLTSMDSVSRVFNKYFGSEMTIEDVAFPLSIYNGEHDFYLARVTIIKKRNGKTKFRHLKYASIYDKKKLKLAY